jgi:hypothetical protein
MRSIVSPLDGFASPFGPQRGFNPLRIFANDEPGVWFEANDANTLFTDVAGTTPATTPGDAVALQLDKSQGLTLGPELADLSTATVSDFDGSAGVIDAVNNRFENTSATASLNSYPRILWSGILTEGKFYKVEASSTEALVAVQTGGTGGVSTYFSGGVFSGVVQAGSNGNFAMLFDGRETFDVAVSISVRELPGNHRTQATTAARPLYALHPVGGVRNLLEYTEEFDNAVWGKTTVTITADDATAPDGTTSADLFQHSSAGGQIDQDFTVTSGATATISLYIKAKTNGFLRLLVADGSRLNSFGGWFNTSTGEFETANDSGVGVLEGTSVQQIGDYYRVSVTGNIPGNTIYSYFFYAVDADGSFTRSTTPEFWVWGAQAEEGSTATNYQRVGSFLDVSEEGKARRGRLWYNGTSHFMQTPTITPGTDKVQVFAGVRKLSDVAIQCLYETSSDTPSNNGTIVALPAYDGGAGSGAYWFAGSKGTTLRGARSAASFAAPQTVVHTHLSDISGDSVILRIDGTQVAQNTGDQGTGNYLAYPLYFGARGGTSLFYNGYEDTSIIRFGPNLDADTISKVESYVASKTPEETI